MELSNILDVKRGVPFTVNGLCDLFVVDTFEVLGSKTETVRYYIDGEYGDIVDAHLLSAIIKSAPHEISSLIPLTDEQRVQLLSLKNLGLSYLVKNEIGYVHAFGDKPTKCAYYWYNEDDKTPDHYYTCQAESPISSLVSFEDDEPLDIWKTLGYKR